MNDGKRIGLGAPSEVPDEGRTLGGSGGGVPPEVMARFTAAEARLYPMALSDPEGYELATTVVGIVVAELRDSCPDVASILSRRADLVSRVPELVQASGSMLGGLPPDVVADAACALRCREVAG